MSLHLLTLPLSKCLPLLDYHQAKEKITAQVTFFSLFQMSAHIRFRLSFTKKNMFFFCSANALDCWRFSKKKQLILGDIRTFRKNKLISGHKKHFSSYVFLLVFFIFSFFIFSFTFFK